jgi:hypothetical protein
MVRLFRDGKWVCDTGEHWDRNDCLETIGRKERKPGEEWVPIKQTITTVTEYHP